MTTINKERAKEIINKSNGRIFSAVFIKKDQTHRLMNARLGKHYKSKTGKAAPYKAKEFDLLPVYDMKIKAFRMLNFNTLLTLSINKNIYHVEQIKHLY